jgi:hypothetical protein
MLHRGTRGFVRASGVDDVANNQLTLNTAAVVQAEVKVQPLLLESEWDAYTAEQGCAIAQVQRGGVRRRDVIRTKPMFEMPAEFIEDHGGEAKETTAEVEEGARSVERADEADGTAAREQTSVAMRPVVSITEQTPIQDSTVSAAASMHAAAAEAERSGTFDADAMFGPRPGVKHRS